MNKHTFHTLFSMIRCSQNLSNANDFRKRNFKELLTITTTFDKPEWDMVWEFVKTYKDPVPETGRQQLIKKLAGRRSGPVFYISSGMDCDGLKFGHGESFKNQYDADNAIEDMIEDAEGAMYFNPCTKEEFENFSCYKHDTVAEARGTDPLP